ncbi:hypothetical protein ZIOFF_038234 [Zingiber officinale]|uniref:Uncharacterized protein n=1 Tax=Zingiber officinale TaxID=94328 RepID=A0A8J5G2A3_ZINOF|nr:hypothetical protein ZIOFF_038234 [Zingiber officinale]
MVTMMQDLAASLLMEFEKWVLRAESSGTILKTPLDSQSSLGAEEFIKAKKRRLARAQKTIGDYCLLAGSPVDANAHYSTAIELARLTGDVFWHAGALEGSICALLLDQMDYKDPVLEEEVKYRYYTAIQLYRRSYLQDNAQRVSTVSFELEATLKLARYLCRRELAKEVVDLLMGAADGAKSLIDANDRLILYVEIARLFGTLGYQRKAAFFSRQVAQLYLQQDNSCAAISAMQVLTMTSNAYRVQSRRKSQKISPVSQELGASHSDGGKVHPQLVSLFESQWSSIQMVVLREILMSSVRAGDPLAAWSAAARLLRSFYPLITPAGQSGLASSLANSAERLPSGTRCADPALPFIRLDGMAGRKDWLVAPWIQYSGHVRKTCQAAGGFVAVRGRCPSTSRAGGRLGGDKQMRRADARNRSIWLSVARRKRENMAGGNHEIRERLSSLEVLLGAVPDGEDVCNLVAKIFNLEANLEQIQESLPEEMAQIRKNNEDLCYEVIVLRRAMTSSVETGSHCQLVRVPESKSFGGTRSAKELENFLWDMEQYFVAAKVPETEKNMSEEDKLYNFLYGLQPWAQVELRRQNVKDLPSAIIVVDALVDLRMSKENLNTSSSSKPNFIRKDKKGDWKKDCKKDVKKKDLGNNQGKGKAEHSVARGKDNVKNQSCFLCNDPHFAKDCPKCEKLNALLVGDKGETYEQEVATLVNPLQLLNTLVDYESIELLTNMSEDMVRAHSQLLHITIELNGKIVNVMVDTGATHTFVSAKLVKDYGLSIRKCPSYIKSMNAKAQAVVGMTYNVPLPVGTQVGKANMMVIPLEDFQIIIGMEFLRKTKMVPMPHLDGVMVMQESNPCFVSAVHPYGKGQNKGKTNIISATSLEKGLRRGETTYLAALIDAKSDQNVELPVGVQDILSKFEDVMPSELPKCLPPRRNVDHKIELIPGVVPPAISNTFGKYKGVENEPAPYPLTYWLAIR